MEMDVAMRETIRRGELIRQLLIQKRLEHRDLFEQIVALTAVEAGWFGELPPHRARVFINELVRVARREHSSIVRSIVDESEPPSDWRNPLSVLASSIRFRFMEQTSETNT